MSSKSPIILPISYQKVFSVSKVFQHSARDRVTLRRFKLLVVDVMWKRDRDFSIGSMFSKQQNETRFAAVKNEWNLNRPLIASRESQHKKNEKSEEAFGNECWCYKKIDRVEPHIIFARNHLSYLRKPSKRQTKQNSTNVEICKILWAFVVYFWCQGYMSNSVLSILRELCGFRSFKRW